MRYLIDTCVISEFVKRKPNDKVRYWFNQQIETNLFISIAEIKKGIYKIKFSQPEKALRLQNWLDKLELSFSQRTLPLNDEEWAQFSAMAETEGNKTAVMDSLIAATAAHCDLTIATRNINDFKAFPLRVINPFEVIA